MEKFVKYLGTAILLLVCAMFVIRCFMVADKSAFSRPVVTEALRSAYADGEAVTYTAEMHREISEDGYFSAYGFCYTPETGDVQLAVRWNNSVYGYTDMAEGHEFTFHLLNETTGETYPVTVTDSRRKAMYHFRRLQADGVVCGDTDQLVIVMELRDGHESRMVLKYAEQTFESYKLPGDVRKELGL